MDDESLIRAVLAGDLGSFRALVERYQRLVFAIARSFFRDDERVEDLSQEAFLAAYAGLARYRAERGTFAAWLATIARNRCRDALRKRPDLPPGIPPDHEPVAAPAVGSERELDARLGAALARLPAERRLAFLLIEVHELTNEQVAEIEGVAAGTIRSRVSRARTELRALLQPEMETDG